MTKRFDRSLSLEQLEEQVWDDAEPTDTPMIKRIYALRKKPLSNLSDGELRLAISQRVGAPYVIDVALDRLQQNAMIDADYYPGDLLSALIRAKDEFWGDRVELRPRLAPLYAYVMAQPLETTEMFRNSLGLPTQDLLPN